jgi:hypothetical protein
MLVYACTYICVCRVCGLGLRVGDVDVDICMYIRVSEKDTNICIGDYRF